MLALKDLRYNFLTWTFLCKLCVLFFRFDPHTGKVWVQSGDGKRFGIWGVQMALFLTGILFKSLRFLQSIFYEEYFVVSNFCFHAMWLSMGALSVYGLWVSYDRRHEVAFLLTEIHRMKSNMAAKGSGKGSRRYALPEMILMTWPSFVYGVLPSNLVLYLNDPNAVYLIYSVVPDGWRNPLVMSVTMGMDLWVTATCMTSIYLGGYVILSFATSHVHDDILCNLEAEILRKYATVLQLKRYCIKLRQICLEIDVYNDTFSNVQYVLKLVLMVNSMYGFFAGIRYSGVMPGLAMALCVMGIQSMLAFILLLGRAYIVHDKFCSIKDLVGVKSKRNPFARDYVQRVLKSMPDCEILCRLQKLDRMATPTFCDYIVNEVVNLLITFP